MEIFKKQIIYSVYFRQTEKDRTFTKKCSSLFSSESYEKGGKAALYKSSREMRKEKLHVHVVSNSPHHDAGR